MELPDFLTRVDHGGIRLTGTRISLWLLLRSYNEGATAEMLVHEYPSVPLAQAHKVIAYYLENRAEVDAYLAQVAALQAHLEATLPRVDLDALRARLAARQAAKAG